MKKLKPSLSVFAAAVVCAVGVATSVAIASPTTFSATTTATTGDTTTGGTTTDQTTTNAVTTNATTTASSDRKVWLCHRTGSKKHPYHLIHVAAASMKVRKNHGDFAPTNGSCTAPAAPTTTSATVTTSATETTSTVHGKGHTK